MYYMKLRRQWPRMPPERVNGMKVALDMTGKRLLNRAEMVAYTGMGKTAGGNWCRKIGAVRHIGARVLYDRKVIDAAIDALKE